MALANQQIVYERFSETEKLTIPELTQRVWDYAKEQDNQNLKLSDRTIRRSLETLVENGFLKTFGKRQQAVLYGKVSSSFIGSTDPQKMIPFSGELVTVEDFLHHVVEPDSDPLSLKVPMLKSEIQNHIRRRLAFVVLSSGETGLNDEVAKTKKELETFTREIEFLYKLLTAFVNSPVWYTQYRDGIGYEMRKVQQKDPDLFQLTIDFVKGG